MNILGIIVEYNPFHNGHIYHINKSKEITGSDHTLAIMSGSFTQRGDIAIIDKFTRANIALQHGIDLVLELPTIYATSSSDYFAFGAINILDSLNCVDYLSFGSESDNISDIEKLATLLIANKDEIDKEIIILQKDGISYPKARQISLSKYLSLDSKLFNSNNILATHYLKNLQLLNSSIKPVLIKRSGNLYNDLDLALDSNMASATSLRTVLYNKEPLEHIKSFVPEETYQSLANSKLLFNDDFFNILRYSILANKNNLKNISEVVEGLENKIYSAALISKSYNELVSNIKSKRYTETKIRRILINILLNISKELLANSVCNKSAYVRVLAMNEKGKEVLSEISKHSDISLITKINDNIVNNLNNDIHNLLKLDITATNIYDICKNNNLNNDFLNKL